MARNRGRGEGSIYQDKKTGRWIAQATIQGKRMSLYGRTQKEAQAKLRLLLADADKGILPPEKLTLGEYLKRWLEDVAKPSVRPTTYRSYEQLIRVHISPLLGKVKLGDLQPAHVQKLHATMQAQGRARNTVQRAHRVLHNALNRALAWGYIQRNVCTVVHPPTPERNKLRTLTPEQVKALLSETRGGRWDALVTLAIATGMRKGELLGLNWADVDLERGVLRVQRQLDRDGRLSEPKTHTARRGIHLPPSTVAVLREHRLHQNEQRLLLGPEWVDEGLVFCTHQGRPLDPRNVNREYKMLPRRAGLPDVRFHDLRHTAATLMLLQGAPVKVVQGRLGHSQISLTLDTYSHVLPSMDREVADKLDALLV